MRPFVPRCKKLYSIFFLMQWYAALLRILEKKRVLVCWKHGLKFIANLQLYLLLSRQIKNFLCFTVVDSWWELSLLLCLVLCIMATCIFMPHIEIFWRVVCNILISITLVRNANAYREHTILQEGNEISPIRALFLSNMNTPYVFVWCILALTFIILIPLLIVVSWAIK
jgi:hypothetical protein